MSLEVMNKRHVVNVTFLRTIHKKHKIVIENMISIGEKANKKKKANIFRGRLAILNLKGEKTNKKI